MCLPTQFHLDEKSAFCACETTTSAKLCYFLSTRSKLTHRYAPSTPQHPWRILDACKLLKMAGEPCKPEFSSTFLFSITYIGSTNAGCPRRQVRHEKQDFVS